MFQNAVGKYELEVTTFQMAVLFAWNQRPEEKISFESLRWGGWRHVYTQADSYILSYSLWLQISHRTA